MKVKKIIRQREYVSMDSYAYVIRSEDGNKILATGWTEEEAEKEFKKITNKTITK